MKSSLSLLIITKNFGGLIGQVLEAVKDLADEVVIVYESQGDSGFARSSLARMTRQFQYQTDDFGKRKAFGLAKCRGEWVLVLDDDEIVTPELKEEINNIRRSWTSQDDEKNIGYYIPFQNHFLGRPVNYGGEDYKMLRLFRKDSVFIKPALVHEGFVLKKGNAGYLKNKINHYSGLIATICRFLTSFEMQIPKYKRNLFFTFQSPMNTKFFF